jgi:hypothetical protein
MKLNCWQYSACGRETGGRWAAELGVCPASTESRLDGVHDGENAGRACWASAGTFCEGEVQGTFAAKLEACSECDFYGIVQRQEGAGFTEHEEIAARLQ